MSTASAAGAKAPPASREQAMQSTDALMMISIWRRKE